MDDQASALRNSSVKAPRGARPSGRRLRCLAVGSGKGGVGKTVVSVGLAYSLSRLGFKVLVVDADLGLANVDLQMGVDPRFTLQDVVFGRSTLEEAVIDVQGGPSLLAAASGSQEMVDMGAARRQMFAEELVKFAGHYEFVIIDVAAGIGEDVITFLSAAPEVLVVVANEPTSLMDAYALVKTLRKNPEPPDLTAVINMVKTVDDGYLLAEKLNATTRRFLGVELPVAGIIPYDSIVGDAIRARRSVVKFAPRSVVSCTLEDIARQVSSGKSYMRVGSRSQKSVFDKLVSLGQSTEDDNS